MRKERACCLLFLLRKNVLRAIIQKKKGAKRMIKTFCFTQEAPKEAEEMLDKRARHELIIQLMNELKFNQIYELKFEKKIERGTWEKRYTYNLRLKERSYDEYPPQVVLPIDF
nr:MAG TPA: hypothetical protein [Caudoviricetes sp.]